MTITEAGIYDLPPEAYHADPCPEPSLSGSIARRLLTQTPMHARYHHPRLNPDAESEDTSRAMDDGNVVHRLLLGKGSDIEVVDAVYGPKHKLAGQPVADFKTDVAAEARDAIRERGNIPVLPSRLAELHKVAAIARAQIELHPDACALFEPGRAEMTLAAQIDGAWCRTLVDWLPDDPRAPLIDIKCTEMSAAPGSWERRLREIYCLQDAFNSRVVKAVRGIYPPPMLFVVIELNPPHAVSVVASAPSLRTYAEAEIDRALHIWRTCSQSGRWPGYPPFTAYVEAPTWLLTRQDERALRDEIMEEIA